MALGESRFGRRQILKMLLGLGIGTITGSAAWGYFYERYRLEVARADLPIENLPPALEGLKIAMLTDTHRSASVPEALIREAAQRAVEAKPDLIVLGGDYVTWGDRQFVRPSAEALAALDAPLGVFAVLGNHDDDRDMPAALAQRGFTVLRDARTTISVRGEAVELIGIRFWTRKFADLERLVKGARGFPVLIAHDPRRLRDATALQIPLMLSGHTHGGQVLLPGVGPFLAKKFPVLSGPARVGHTTIYVSRGIGTVYMPVRLNCPPEVTVLTLRQG
jgi:predicted MPP superfamily phosphohydrolase